MPVLTRTNKVGVFFSFWENQQTQTLSASKSSLLSKQRSNYSKPIKREKKLKSKCRLSAWKKSLKQFWLNQIEAKIYLKSAASWNLGNGWCYSSCLSFLRGMRWLASLRRIATGNTKNASTGSATARPGPYRGTAATAWRSATSVRPAPIKTSVWWREILTWIALK